MPVPQTKTGLQDEAYRLYQLDWMASHGESPESLAMSILEHHVAGADPEDPDTQAIANMGAVRSRLPWRPVGLQGRVPGRRVQRRGIHARPAPDGFVRRVLPVSSNGNALTLLLEGRWSR